MEFQSTMYTAHVESVKTAFLFSLCRPAFTTVQQSRSNTSSEPSSCGSNANRCPILALQSAKSSRRFADSGAYLLVQAVDWRDGRSKVANFSTFCTVALFREMNFLRRLITKCWHLRISLINDIRSIDVNTGTWCIDAGWSQKKMTREWWRKETLLPKRSYRTV